MNRPKEFRDDDMELFDIDWEEKAIRTKCGDFYHDYDISFRNIKELYELIEKYGGEDD